MPGVESKASVQRVEDRDLHRARILALLDMVGGSAQEESVLRHTIRRRDSMETCFESNTRLANEDTCPPVSSSSS